MNETNSIVISIFVGEIKQCLEEKKISKVEGRKRMNEKEKKKNSKKIGERESEKIVREEENDWRGNCC